MSKPGFLIITRPLFIDSLNEYVQWKQSKGFVVYIKTAEEIDTQFTGAELRFKIRNCIRHYHNISNVKYVLLIGDSINITEITQGEPHPVILSESWNLPSGYYRMDRMINGQPQVRSIYTSLFYSDLEDIVHYDKSEYSGNYEISVGLIPVRTHQALVHVLRKTIDSIPITMLHVVYSEDDYDPTYAEKSYQQIEALGGNKITMSKQLFGSTSPDDEVYHALCTQAGCIYASGHGLMDPDNPNHQPGFKIGNVWACAADSEKLTSLNRLYIISSCYAGSYHLGECIDESWLHAAKGPVTMISKVPLGRIPLPEGGLRENAQGFWKNVLAGKTIGQAFYGNCHGAYGESLNLFGAPSLVIFRPRFILSTFDWKSLIVGWKNKFNYVLQILFSNKVI